MEINVPDVQVHPSLDNPHAYNSQTYHKLIRMGQKVLDKWILKKKKKSLVYTWHCSGIQIIWEWTGCILVETKAQRNKWSSCLFLHVLLVQLGSTESLSRSPSSHAEASTLFLCAPTCLSTLYLHNKHMRRVPWLWAHDFPGNTSVIFIYKPHPQDLVTCNYAPFI